MKNEKTKLATPYDLDGRTPLRLAIPLGLQHVLAMFVGNLTPLLVIAGAANCALQAELQITLLQNAMIIAGLVTLLQLYPIGPVGGRLPIVMGTSSGFIGVCASIAASIMAGDASASRCFVYYTSGSDTALLSSKVGSLAARRKNRRIAVNALRPIRRRISRQMHPHSLCRYIWAAISTGLLSYQIVPCLNTRVRFAFTGAGTAL